MASLFWIIPFAVLVLIFVVVGSRDLVGFVRIGPGKTKRFQIWLAVLVWLAGFLGMFYFWGRGSAKVFAEPIFWTVFLGLALILAVLLGLARPLRQHGPGRMYALAWATFQEAMSQRAYLAVPLWLIGVVVVGLFVSPYRLIQDRMMLSTQLLVGGQLLVVGVLMLTLGCRSIPRELDRKTILITASKPINMLEYVAGKLLGFILTGAVLVGAMGVLSYGILWYHGQEVRRQGRLQLAIQEEQYQSRQREVEPDSDLKEIAERGVLYARDPVYPIGNVSFNGKFDVNMEQQSCLKGGSGANIQWRFDEMPVTGNTPPLLRLSFWVERVPEEIIERDDFEATAPLTISVEGVSSRFPRRFKVKKQLEMPVPAVLEQVGLKQSIGFPLGGRLILDSTEWYELYNIGPVVFTVTFAAKGHYLYFGAGSLVLGQFSGEQAELAGGISWSEPGEDGRGVVVAHKFKNAYEISGVELGQPEVGYWHFKNVSLADFGPGKELTFEIQSYREKSDVIKSYTVGLVRALSVKPDGRMEFWPKSDSANANADGDGQGESAEVQLLERDWPDWDQIVIQERRPSTVNLPRRLFSKDADVYVFLACGSPKGWIALGEKSGYLARVKRSFAGNVLRCELIVFMQISVIAAVAVMASSFLSWPVACFLSLVIYLLGSAQSFLQNTIRFHGIVSERITGLVVELAARTLPGFETYKAADFISEGELIPLEKLSELFNHTGLCILSLLIAGYLFLRCRELAK